jgi:hypothetical protein
MRAATSGRLIWLASLLILALALAGCRGREATEVSVAPAVVAEAGAFDTPTPADSVPPTPRDAVPTVRSTPTATPGPTASPTPTPAPTSTPTPTPAPQAVQLTTGGCCTQPYWSPDSQEVRFIDKRGAEALAGI